MVGAIALASMETNEIIANDDGIMNAMVAVLSYSASRKMVVVALCNAFLDLSTCSIGRKRLIEFPILVKLVSLFCQIASTTCTLLASGKKLDEHSKDVVKEDKYTATVLSAALALINTSDETIPSNIPGELIKCFSVVLRELWFMLKIGRSTSSIGENGYMSIYSDIAEAIFRLFLDDFQYSFSLTDMVGSTFFGETESDLWQFFLENWEQSPFLFKNSLTNSKGNDSIFSSLFHSWVGRTSDVVLNSILGGIISCPPIVSDELDILSFLKEASKLGSPPVYGQDIRMVKTVRIATLDSETLQEKEMHFFNGEAVNKEFLVNYMEKCKEAFQEGYTIAVRGMGFRSQKISAVACCLADMFGLPSVGANIYLTPPRSQGLPLHFDDHCVLICQLLGKKHWKIYPPKKTILPQLYQTCDNCFGLDGKGDGIGVEHLTLNEGDILYIPRGYFHEANTFTVEDEARYESDGCLSLHLTLAIEVELPFEWEGFMHISLRCWNEKKKSTSSTAGVEPSFSAIVSLLHIGIRALANQESSFRKACMISAHLPESLMEQHISLQKNIFIDLISQINIKCGFAVAFENLEVAAHRSINDLLQWFRWLRHVPGGDENEKIDVSNPLESFSDIITMINHNRDDAKEAFEIAKAKFCSEVVFKDACKSFEVLLERYRRTRRQYTNGMLSLHPNRY